MSNTFFRDVNDLPDPNENTPPIDVTPAPLPRAHGEIATVMMATDEGRPVGVVMVGSIAHRALLEGGFTEVQS